MLPEKRNIVFHEDYFTEFYLSLDDKTRRKTTFVLQFIESAVRIPDKFLKHLEGTKGLYEIRFVFRGRQIRIFCFFDKSNNVVLLNAFIKKSKKTPGNHLTTAIQLKNDYDEKEKAVHHK